TSTLFSHSTYPSVMYRYLFTFYVSGAHRDLHSFPTRRSSDLCRTRLPSPAIWSISPWSRNSRSPRPGSRRSGHRTRSRPFPATRSEEHTSELQSHLNLVCRLLLEKKKKKNSILAGI